MAVRIQASHPRHVQYGRRLITVKLPMGLPPYEEIVDELMGYCDVLLGRQDPPLMSPYLAMAEVAGAYYARAREIEMLIYQGELDGSIERGSHYYKLRTGQLNSFIEMSKRLYELGSRRLAQEDLISRQRIDLGEIQ